MIEPLAMLVVVVVTGVVGLIIGAAASQILSSTAGYSPSFNRNRGEALVAHSLSQLTRNHVLINNVTLPTEGGTTQIDHILVTESGIFVIETKNFAGWIFGSPNQSQWTQAIYRIKSRFQNPLHQNFGHVKAIQSLFKLPETAFAGLVVFTGTAEFKTNLGPSVIYLNQLLDFMQQQRGAVLDERQMAYVVGRIEMKRLRRSLETDEYHLNSLRQKFARA